MTRDYTYIDDVVEGITKILAKPPTTLSNHYKKKNSI